MIKKTTVRITETIVDEKQRCCASDAARDSVFIGNNLDFAGPTPTQLGGLQNGSHRSIANIIIKKNTNTDAIAVV